MLIGSNHAVKNARELDAVLDDKVSKQSEHFIYLGVNIDNRLNWNNHVSCVSSKVYTKLQIINRISLFLNRNVLLRIYKQSILPILDYASIVWLNCGKQNIQCLERLQNHAMRIILSSHRHECTQEMRNKLVLLSSSSRRRFLRLSLVFKIVQDINCPDQLKGYLRRRFAVNKRSFRDATLWTFLKYRQKWVRSLPNSVLPKTGTNYQGS